MKDKPSVEGEGTEEDKREMMQGVPCHSSTNENPLILFRKQY